MWLSVLPYFDIETEKEERELFTFSSSLFRLDDLVEEVINKRFQFFLISTKNNLGLL